jgi:uncharacterized membrane protein
MAFKDKEVIFIEQNTKLILLGLSIFILISVLSAIYFYNSTFNWLSPAPNRGEWGAMGDYFGGLINPILSFVTIVLLLLSIKIQVRELKATTQELRETKEVHQESVMAQDRNLMFAPLTKRIDQVIEEIEALKGQPVISSNISKNNIGFVEQHLTLFDIHRKGLEGLSHKEESFQVLYVEGLVKNLGELKRNLCKINMLLSELYRVKTPKIAFITDELETLTYFMFRLLKELEVQFTSDSQLNVTSEIESLKSNILKLNLYVN